MKLAMVFEVITALFGLVSVLAAFGAVVFTLFADLHGIYMAFNANVLIGFGTLLFPPAGFWIGVADWYGHVDLAARLAQALGLH